MRHMWSAGLDGNESSNPALKFMAKRTHARHAGRVNVHVVYKNVLMFRDASFFSLKQNFDCGILEAESDP